jgi:hypothetical protein
MKSIKNPKELIITVLASVAFGFAFGHLFGWKQADKDFKTQAINHGYAEWTASNTGKTLWQWKQIK